MDCDNAICLQYNELPIQIHLRSLYFKVTNHDWNLPEIIHDDKFSCAISLATDWRMRFQYNHNPDPTTVIIDPNGI